MPQKDLLNPLCHPRMAHWSIVSRFRQCQQPTLKTTSPASLDRAQEDEDLDMDYEESD